MARASFITTNNQENAGMLRIDPPFFSSGSMDLLLDMTQHPLLTVIVLY